MKKAWARLQWHLKELDKMYSGEHSFYSKKRIESGIAFIVLQWGMVHWMILNVGKIPASEMAIWAGIEIGIITYQIHHTQKEKKLKLDQKDGTDDEP